MHSPWENHFNDQDKLFHQMKSQYSNFFTSCLTFKGSIPITLHIQNYFFYLKEGLLIFYALKYDQDTKGHGYIFLV